MSETTKQKIDNFSHLLNGTTTSFKNVIPLPMEIGEPEIFEKAIKLEFGVLIEIIGDVKGKMVLSGTTSVFSMIGEKMFGMSLKEDMLSSFSGELGNMIAGGMSTNLIDKGINTDITFPSMLEGSLVLKGYKKALHVPIAFEHAETMTIYLLLD